jgi:hypothetical protein
MRVNILALAVFLTFAFVHTASSQDRTFGDFDCTDDCSGHAAGYKWADQHNIDNEGDCPFGNSQSFHEGCVAHTRDPGRGAEEDDGDNPVGEPVERPDPDDEDK